MQIRFPFVKIAVLFTIGILLRQWAAVPFWIFIVFIIPGSLLLVKSSANQKKYLAGLWKSLYLALLIILCGNETAVIHSVNTSYIPESIYKQNDLTAYGEVIKVSLLNKKGFTFNLQCDSVEFNGSKIKKQAEVIVNIKRENLNSDFIGLYNSLSPGDYVKTKGLYLKGREQRNPGEFDYNKFLRTKGISGIINALNRNDVSVIKHSGGNIENLFRKTRESISGKINSLHDYETASLLKGLLLADRSDIEEDINSDFINSGVVHVLAVSGLHVAFIVMIIVFFCGRFHLSLRIILIACGIIFYTMLTGAPASVVRASIMSIVLLISLFSNRETNLLNAISISALIILAVSPSQIYDPGFQLSYAAVISIAVLYPVFLSMDIIKNIQNRNLQKLILFLLLSLSAQLGTLPFVLMYFGKISMTALLANILVIPLSGIILGNGIFTVILSYIAMSLAVYPAMTSILLVKVLYSLTHVLGGYYSFIPVYGFNKVNFLFFYLFLVIFFYWLPQFKTVRSRLVLFVLIVLDLFLFSSIKANQTINRGELSVIAIDVGQGDAFLVRFPDGQSALVDAGEASIRFDNGERVVLPLLDYLNVPFLDYAFISHMDKDHYSGILTLIKNNKVKRIYMPAPERNDSLSIKFELFCESNKVPVFYYTKKHLSIGNTRVYMLNDKLFQNNNDNSGVIKILYDNTSFLFTGDDSKRGEKHYLEYGPFLRSTVLKVAHHGSKTANSEEFLKSVSPQYSIISAGIKNKYHHPDSEVIARLNDCRTEILRTDLEGAVWLKSDGEKISRVNWK